jgi:glutathione S-transferase
MPHPKLELISFSVCPFVMRARLLLELKKVEYALTQIDIENKPDWFLAISPLGKVPVLRVGDDAVIFESQVIAEYLDETTPGSLHQEDPLARARDRAWIEFATNLILTNFGHLLAGDAQAQATTRAGVDRLFAHLEGNIKGDPYFNGDRFLIIDAAYAPLFVQLDTVRAATGTDLLAGYPKLSRWSEALLAHDAVRAVVPGDFAEKLAALLTKKGSAYFVRAA